MYEEAGNQEDLDLILGHSWHSIVEIVTSRTAKKKLF
jgi:hypothetical protein